MEEILMKYVELGALGVFSLLLLTKGLSALNLLSTSLTELSKSQEKLADTVSRLAEKVYSVDSRVSNIEREIAEIKLMTKSILERTDFK